MDKDIEHNLLRLLTMCIDSESVGTYLNNMFWGVLRFNRQSFQLLTSDRPTIMTNGIKYSNSHIVLPISPNRVFVAASTKQTLREVDRKLKHADAPKFLNDVVARQSRRFVYATDASQLKFVANRLGQARKSTPFE
jgi:hypothetical protein